LRAEFRPGLAETKDAECLEAVYAALKAQREHQKKTGEYPKGADLVGHKHEDLWKLINYSKVLSAKNLYRKYGKLVTSVMPPIEPGLARVPASSRFRDKRHS
jgi:hypothetical protein